MATDPARTKAIAAAKRQGTQVQKGESTASIQERVNAAAKAKYDGLRAR